jgi:hypothetical protein
MRSFIHLPRWQIVTRQCLRRVMPTLERQLPILPQQNRTLATATGTPEAITVRGGVEVVEAGVERAEAEGVVAAVAIIWPNTRKARRAAVNGRK